MNIYNNYFIITFFLTNFIFKFLRIKKNFFLFKNSKNAYIPTTNTSISK